MSLIAVPRWSIRQKLVASVLLCLVLGVAVSVATGLWLTRGAMEQRVVGQELPAVLGGLRAQLQRQVGTPLAASLGMADNHFLLQWERAGQPAAGLADFQAYAARLKARQQATAVFWVSQARGRWLSDAGEPRPLGEDAGWFGRFLTSGRPYAMALQRGAEGEGYRLSIHARFDAGPGQAGLAGLSLPASTLVQRVNALTLGDTGLVMLVRPDGRIVSHPDSALADGGHSLADLPAFAPAAVARLLDDAEDFQLTVQPAPDGTRVLAATYVPELNLYLVATVPRAELLAAATRAAWTGPLAGMAASALLALPLALLLGWRPLQRGGRRGVDVPAAAAAAGAAGSSTEAATTTEATTTEAPPGDRLADRAGAVWRQARRNARAAPQPVPADAARQTQQP